MPALHFLGSRLDAPIRYFAGVYPLLRGVRGGAPLARHLTEKGRDDRLAWVLREFEGVEPESVLDAGCGVGGYAVALAERGHRVTAVDVSEVMLATTRRAALDAGVADRIELVHDDLRNWTPPRPFATVLNLGVAEYYPDAEEMLARQYSWAERRMLVTWSAAGVGPRAALRRLWLALNGLQVKLLEESELVEMLAQLPDAEVRAVDTFWTHCAVVRRGRPSGPGG